ncbi:LysR substrate-binding domain-containing protein [Photobacterium sp. WH77]|uniref:LysR substrate-binding domain-containing protein n=1 Tax=unclassified Photobacterium TaxID=2628852 RepID=UPI001C47B3CB|nr:MULTISPECIES: LysR substrate-binding domain-containing protein [unclassified Photobacterium]MBV7264246.1 LysR family transcriptional regulator [Photobacterium sp. WH24]MCG2838148.1 LysR substrate-binding domain-containing protein [Photobacterium sp. WH77]MCG2845766.1 LysR substrate-binding domain-containing protein [Photobacterium sp. WH80]
MSVIKGNLLAALATFDVAARTTSFTGAASRLHITTGAVSQQIRQLEQQLGFPVFQRHARGIILTEQGQRLHQVVSRSLTDIAEVIRELQTDPQPEGEIRLRLTPSFAFKWLVPRLHDFYQHYPDINIQTYADGALVDSRDTDCDLVIDYRRDDEIKDDGKTSLLMAESLLPVMSPDYQAKFDWLHPQAWHQVTLLHDAMPWRQAERDTEWRYWFNSMHIQADSRRGHFFNRTDMAMAAAEAGLGVAMARQALIGDDVNKGRLVSPFAPLQANAGYYLISHRHSAAIDCFVQWLRAQIDSMPLEH